ncbi:MAG TPA: outer membrane beta-barrel protein [Longimicrobium sp.]|nr:outer membrane beta-barrel protein [Longimicrobium sp.]
MRTLLMLSAALLLAAPAVAAQTSPFSLEVRGRAAFPTGDFGEEEDGIGVKTGWGGTVEGLYQATPLLGVYAGYGYTRFPTDLGELEELLDDASIDITDAGFDAGARITLPVLNGGAFVRGGLVYHRAAVDLSEELQEFFEAVEPAFNEDDLESGWSLGYQLGAGALVPLGQRLSASVGAAYTRYEPEFEDGSTTEVSSDGALSYASVEVGLQIRL